MAVATPARSRPLVFPVFCCGQSKNAALGRGQLATVANYRQPERSIYLRPRPAACAQNRLNPRKHGFWPPGA